MPNNKIQVHDVGKLGLFALLIICSSALLALDKIGMGEWGIVSIGVFSYLTGNGLLATRGKIGSNALGPAVEPLTPPEAAALKALASTAARVEGHDLRGE